jgi:hypothetical protein
MMHRYIAFGYEQKMDINFKTMKGRFVEVNGIDNIGWAK